MLFLPRRTAVVASFVKGILKEINNLNARLTDVTYYLGFQKIFILCYGKGI